MLRRNGKLRSCEPCRISKIKCDHATPTCAKCQTRGVADQCFYHPNPMTKPAGTPRKKPEPRRRKGDARSSIGQSPQGHDRLSSLTLSPPTLRNHVGTVPLNSSFPSPPDSTTRHTPAVGGSTRGFYLGSTSYASVFMEDRPLPDTLHEQPSERTSMTPAPPSLGTRHCQMDVAHSIISKLTPFSFYEKLVVSYFVETWASALIGPLVTSCLPQLAEDIRRLTSPGTNVYEEYARITKNTAKPLKISSTVLPSDFHTLITGENLRWETLGMILTLAVCNAQMMSPDDPMFILDSEKKVDRDQFVEDMIQVSNDCINLCQIHGACSDIMVWLLYCNLCIVSGHYGDNYHGAWRRLGDIVSSLYAAGIHCESESASPEPIFLRETRRRVYASVYWQDKLLAMFFGRPPLMAWRYSDRKQLLDISDLAVGSADPAVMEEAISKLGVGGWNTEGKVHPASYLRLRCQHAVFKERILEQSLAGEKDEDVVANLQTIASELTDFWQSVPCHMRYDAYKEHGAWAAIGESITVRLITAYLEYLHTYFQVQRMLYRRTQDALPALLHVAFKLLSCAVFATKPDRSYAIRRQVPTMILFACFPAAGVLALELRRCTLEGTSLPNTVSRADIIRNLSVLTSCLEWIYLPGDGNLKLCSELNKMLATVLDEVLNYQPPILSDQSSNGAPIGGTANGFFDMPMMDGMEPIPTESEDFLNWLDNTTWSNNVSLF